MSDLSSPDSSGRGFPQPISFDPASDPVPPTIDGGNGPGPVILLLNTAIDSRWAADAAIALATAWARAGRRIVLADLHLDEPILHGRAGEGNPDGVVDIFLYGASLARSARPVPGRGFYLIPTGTYTTDASAIFNHPRWSKLVVGFRDARASLLLFARGDSPDAESLMQWADAVIVLGERAPGDFVPESQVSAILAPPSAEAAAADHTLEAGEPDQTLESGPDIGVVPVAPDARESAEPFQADPAREEVPVFDPAPGEPAVEADHSPEPALDPPGPHRRAEDGADTAPAIPEGRRARRRREKKMSPLVWVLLGAVALAAIGYLVFASGVLGGEADPPVPTGSVVDVGASGVGATVPGDRPASGAPAAGEPIPYAVQVRALASLDAAREQAAAEEQRVAGTLFYVSPERVNGTLYYKVYAGLPADSTSATLLRQRLADAGTISAADAAAPWTLRYAPLAFDLGDFPTREAAVGRAELLLTLGVPAYPVVLRSPNGSPNWRLYGGAFADSTQAEAMRELLVAAELEAELVPRVGAQ